MESQGLFVSYNEKNGRFQDAVDVSNQHEYLVWLDKSRVQKQRLVFPTTILIKIAGEDRYYLGELRDVKLADEVNRDAMLAEATHRPRTWQDIDKVDYADFKTVLYIAGLKLVPRPAGIPKASAPQRPYYRSESILRGVLADEVEHVRAEKEQEGAFSPSSLEDARKRIFGHIVLRQGQSAFREELLLAYEHTCAVTGCDVVETLEAAHIVPYRGPHTNHVSNGLLLRGDIHTLFDLSLIVLNPNDHRLLPEGNVLRVFRRPIDPLAG